MIINLVGHKRIPLDEKKPLWLLLHNIDRPFRAGKVFFVLVRPPACGDTHLSPFSAEMRAAARGFF